MAPPSADLEDEVAGDGVSNGSEGYVNLSEENGTGYSPVANGGHAETPRAQEAEIPRAQGTVVSINGVEMTVYGNIPGLELLNLGNARAPEIDVDAIDSEEEEEEERQRVEAERAIREAEEADQARRSAPLPAEQCQTIRNAMRGITLDFRPDWAGSIPEQEWMSRVLESGASARQSAAPERS
jgi:hypothetical protein